MKTIILSLALLPNIDYLKSIQDADRILIERHETYKKQTFRNRYLIIAPNGIQTLSVPKARDENHKCQTGQVKISYDDNWQKLHWKSIETAYNSSAFFLYYKDDFKNIFDHKYEYLWDLAIDFLKLIMNKFDIKREIIFTNTFNLKYTDAIDFRERISPKKPNLFFKYPAYYQVFNEKFGFIENLSSLDLLFNLGPESEIYLSKINS